jgi:TP901 family phage tail tape measure protein
MADFGQIGEAFVDIRANFGTFQKDISGAQQKLGRSLQTIGSGFTQVGRSLSIGLTLPLIAAAGAAVKFGSDFSREMTKIETLVGLSAERVKGLSTEVLALSKTAAVGPQELAKALFVITSAGQRGSEAMNILTQAAKASAIGLGDTAEIARAVTSAVNAYGIENLDAARATDILVATVREGNLEASELAGSLGRVLGIAAETGITFAEVGGFIATFTRVGVSAEEAVTSLRSALQILAKTPSGPTVEALDKINFSVDQLRQSVKEKGLAAAFLDLTKRLRDAGIQVAEVFPNLRALSGILAVTGSQADIFAENTEKIADSLGIVDEGFERTRQEADFLFRQLKTSLSAIVTELGTKLLPIVISDVIPALQSFLKLVGSLAESFGNLSTPMQKVILAVGGLLAALGPILLIVGPIVSGIGSLVLAAAALGAGAAAGGGAMLTFGGILSGLLPILATLAIALSTVFVFGFAAFKVAEFASAAQDFADISAQVSRDAQDMSTSVLGSFNALRQAAAGDLFPPDIGESLDELFARFQETQDLESFRNGLELVGLKMKDIQEQAQPTAEELENLARVEREAAEATEALAAEQSAAAAASEKQAEAAAKSAERLAKAQKLAAESTKNSLQPFRNLTAQFNLAKEAGTSAAEFALAFADQIEAAGLKADGAARLFAAMDIEIEKLPPDLQAAVQALRLANAEIKTLGISSLLAGQAIPQLSLAVRDFEGRLKSLSGPADAAAQDVLRLAKTQKELDKETKEAGDEINKLEREIADYASLGVSAERITAKFGTRISAAAKSAKLFGVELGKNTKAFIADSEAKKRNIELADDFRESWNNAIGDVLGNFLKSIQTMDFSFKGLANSLLDTVKNLGRTMLSLFAGSIFKPILKIGQRFASNLADTIFSKLAGAKGPAGGLLGGLNIGGTFKSIGSTIGTAFSKLAPLLTNPITGAIVGIGLAIFGAFKLFTKTPLEAGVKEVMRDFGVEVSKDTLTGFTEGLGLSEEQFKPIRKDILASPLAFRDILLPAAQATGSVDELIASFANLEAFGQVFDLSAEAAAAAEGDFEAFNKRFIEIFGEGGIRSVGGAEAFTVKSAEELAEEEGPGVRTAEQLGDVFIDRLDMLIQTFGEGFELLVEKLQEIVDSLTALTTVDAEEEGLLPGGGIPGGSITINIQALDSATFREFLAGDGGDAFIEELFLRRQEQMLEVVGSAQKGVGE